MNNNTNAYTNHATYGGKIDSLDFDADYEGTRHIAYRIMQDMAFDEQCKQNSLERERRYK